MWKALDYGLIVTTRSISTSELKTHCAEVVQDVASNRVEVLITKRGKPVAKLVPIEAPTSLFGFAKGSITILGDIVNPIDVEWESAG